MVSYQEALDCPPWSTCPFPPDNLVVMSNIKALYVFIIYIHTYVVCNILKWFVECEPFGEKMSNVVWNISELLFETPDFWGDTTTLLVVDVQLFPNYGNDTFLS